MASLLTRSATRAPFLSAKSSMFVSSPLSSTRPVLCVAKPAQAVVVVEAKLKTRKAAAKRFKVTGSGKLMARHCGKQHMNEKKDKARKRDLSSSFVLSKTDVWNATKCLPNHNIGN